MVQYDVVVIGAGPAGLAAALVAARAGHSAAVVEKLGPGGRLAVLEKLYRPPVEGADGTELAATLTEDAYAALVDIVYGTVHQLDLGDDLVVHSDAGPIQARAVVVATGSNILPLAIPGAEGLVSTCASCDGPLHRGKEIAVVGGGDSGAIEALALLGVASRVWLIEAAEDLPCADDLRQALGAAEGIDVLTGSRVVAVQRVGDGVEVEVEGPSGPRRISVGAVFGYPGLAPASDLLQGQLPLDAEGAVVVSQGVTVAMDRVFVAGDLLAGSERSVASALASGRRAGQSAIEALAGS